jgi:archaellum biogenesis protein FlaJ (TadC family)
MNKKQIANSLWISIVVLMLSIVLLPLELDINLKLIIPIILFIITFIVCLVLFNKSESNDIEKKEYLREKARLQAQRDFEKKN